MTIPYRIDRRLARPLLAGVLTLLAAAVLALPAVPAEAGSNWRDGRCSHAYNYADPSSGYLYASTTADRNAYPEPCLRAYVAIWLDGCNGYLLTEATDTDGDGIAATSYSLPSPYWNNPTSTHRADWERMCLAFNY